MEIDLTRFIVEHEIMDLFVKNDGDTMTGTLEMQTTTGEAIKIKNGQKLVFNAS